METSWLAPSAILLSAAAAWILHHRVASKRAGVDFIVGTEIANEVLADARLHFAELTSGDGSDLLALASPSGKEQRESAAKVSLFLNHCELVAVAIKNKAMSEQMYKDWRRTAYVRAWTSAFAYVVAKRNQLKQPTLYANFQRLAEKWAKQDS